MSLLNSIHRRLVALFLFCIRKRKPDRPSSRLSFTDCGVPEQSSGSYQPQGNAALPLSSLPYPPAQAGFTIQSPSAIAGITSRRSVESQLQHKQRQELAATYGIQSPEAQYGMHFICKPSDHPPF